MYLLGVHIELDTDSTIIGLIIFSVLNAVCSTFTIIIYLKMKNLRTLVYRFFFHVAFNEYICRLSLLALNITEKKYNSVLFHIFSTFLFFSDTNIIILTAFTCFGMYQLILKQNNKLGDKFNKISYFLYGSSAVFTLIFSFISWDKNAKDNRDADMYRNIIALNFIVDSNKNDLATVLYAQILYFSLLIFSFVCIILIQVFVKDRENIPSNRESEAESIKDKSIKSSLKLKTFKLKLLAYPLLNFAYIIPLTVYL